MKKHIPNSLTIANLLCGVISIYLSMNGHLREAALLIFAGALFDFFDGAAARLLQVASPIGKELDSLADVNTFGTAPAFLAFQMMIAAGASIYQAAIALAIPAFSALRLAKFNIDQRQTSSFIGLPTPANGFFWAGLVFADTAFMQSRYFLMTAAVVMSLLLVAELPMFSLKFSHLRWKENQLRYIFLLTALALIAFLFFTAIPIIVFLYIVFSIVNNLLFKKNEIQS